MGYVLTSDRDVSIDGIGLLTAGEQKVVSGDEQRLFEAFNKVSLAKANFPDFVRVEYIVEDGR